MLSAMTALAFMLWVRTDTTPVIITLLDTTTRQKLTWLSTEFPGNQLYQKELRKLK
jgi:hypothetical protein